MNEDALRRVERTVGDGVVARLASLPGSDLTTLLLEVVRRRTGDVRPAEVMRRYRTDRFVAPGDIEAGRLRRAEDRVASALPPGTVSLVPAPLVPPGTHAVAGVAPGRLVATVRGTEVAADPTNALALEAAVRRRDALDADPRSAEIVRLAACQRVTRAQVFDGPLFFAHFTLFGFVTAGRDTGDLRFEHRAVAEHAGFVARAVTAATGRPALIGLTDLTGGRMARVIDTAATALEATGVTVRHEPDRTAGRGYYSGVCFSGHVDTDGGVLEVADGGLVDWTQHLVASRKERLMISGMGVDRLANAAST